MILILKDRRTGDEIKKVDASEPIRLDLPDGSQVSPAEAGWSNELYELVEYVEPVVEQKVEEPAVRKVATPAEKLQRLLTFFGMTKEEFLEELKK